MLAFATSGASVLLAFMVSTAAPPTPTECRSLNVAVADTDSITGSVIEQNVVDIKMVRIMCHRPYEGECEGCLLAAGPHEYIIWASDAEALAHERCHALYEEPRHVE